MAEVKQRFRVRLRRDAIIAGLPFGIGTPLGDVELPAGVSLESFVEQLRRGDISPEIVPQTPSPLTPGR